MDPSDENRVKSPSTAVKPFKPSGPALVVVFMMVATVVLIGLLIHWAKEYDPPKGWQTPRAGMTTGSFGDGDHAANVIDVDTEWEVDLIEYRLYDVDGKRIMKGKLVDIYGLDLNASEADITFHDADEDWQLSSGDRFILRSTANGGVAEEGQEFVLRSPSTRDAIVRRQLETSSSGWYGPGIPHLDWQLKDMDQGNISLDLEQSATSHALPLAHTELTFLLDFNYTGSGERTLQLFFRQDGELITERTHTVYPNEDVSFEAKVDIEDVQLEKRWGPVPYGLFEVEVVDGESGESLLSVELPLRSWPERSTPVSSFSLGPSIAIIITVSMVCLVGVPRYLRRRELP